MCIGGIFYFCWSYRPSEPVISVLYGEWYDVKKIGQMEFMPVKGFQFWLLWFAVFQGDCGHSWKGECLGHCDRGQSLSHCRRVTRRCQVQEGVLLGVFIQCRSDPSTHGRAWETFTSFLLEKRGDLFQSVILCLLGGTTPTLGTPCCSYWDGGSAYQSVIGLPPSYVAASVLNSRVTSGDTQNLNINWNI